ncbi:MAG: TonB-dependent receptor [Bacteroidetes bacterium]|nr:TonB-dependent receptor [Bacteroidota bacterium]
MLQNIPSVELDQDGNVSLRGNENVTILIDGRPSGLTGSGGKSLLESIPASAIEKVEVITNPSAKYDPDGISGIINIITKKNKLQGFTGNIGANTSFENRYGANLSLNFRKGKWNFFSNYAFTKDVRLSTGDSYNETYFNSITSIRVQDEQGQNDRIGHNIKFGTDVNIDDRNTLSASALFNTGKNESYESIDYTLSDNINFTDSLYTRNTNGDSKNQNLDFDMAFKHYFKSEGRILNIQGTGSMDKSDENNEYDQLGYIDEVTPVPFPPSIERDNSKSDNKIYTASADYEHPIGKNKKFESGYKSTFRNYDTDLNYETLDPSTGQFLNDTTRTNQFIYNDQLHALYAQYRQSIKKFGYQLGIRSEYATTESELVTTNEIYSKDYFSIFPSAFLTFKPDEKSQLKATYSRRINRPRKQQLNPFTDYEDPLNIRKGNPYLDPEYTDSYELEYSRFIGKFSTTATGYYRLTNDYIQRYRQVTPDGVTVTTFENLAQAQNYGVELILNGSVYKWWNITLSTNMYQNVLDATNLEANLNSSSFAISGRIFTTIKFPYKTELQFTYFYRAPMKVTQGTMKDMQMMTIAVTKKVLKDKGTVSARLSDPFDVQRFGFEFEGTNYYQNFTRKRQSRILTISFTYRFGELKDRDSRQRRDPGPRDDMDFEG